MTRRSARRSPPQAQDRFRASVRRRDGGTGRVVIRALVAGALAIGGVTATAQSPLLQPAPTGPYGPSTQAPVGQPTTTTAKAAGPPPPIQFLLSAEIDVTDNVDLSPSETRKGDVITQITPTLTINRKGAHTNINGTVSAPILLYARTGGENNAVRPEVHLRGTAELLERLFYVDGSVQVSQQFVSPFRARPQDVASATQNRYTAQSYSVAPYLKGATRDGLRYELRDANTWTTANDASINTSRAYTNEITGNLMREPTPLGWALDYNRADTRFSGQDSLLTEVERATLLWKPDPQWELLAIGGYEDNRYPLLTSSGAVFGTGVKWRPTERTTVDTRWEHRFFGTSYHASFEHRTPLTVWTLRALRDITTYPQQLASLGGGNSVAALLDQLFLSRVSDPAQRQSIVNQLIRDRGLPSVLDSPLTLFTQSITLQESVLGSATLVGVRNTILVSAFRTRNEPVGGQAATFDLLTLQTDNTQNGVNVVWTHKLTPLYTLSTGGDWLHTVSNAAGGGRTNQGTLRVVLSAPLSPLTNVFAGARFQRLISNFEPDYHEAAAFVGIGHVFR